MLLLLSPGLLSELLLLLSLPLSISALRAARISPRILDSSGFDADTDTDADTEAEVEGSSAPVLSPDVDDAVGGGSGPMKGRGVSESDDELDTTYLLLFSICSLGLAQRITFEFGGLLLGNLFAVAVVICWLLF